MAFEIWWHSGVTIDLWNYQLFAMGHQFNACDLIMRIVILLSLLLYNMIVYIYIYQYGTLLWYGSLIVSSMFIISIIGHLDTIALAPL